MNFAGGQLNYFKMNFRPIRLSLELKDFEINGLKDATFYKFSGFTEKPEGNKLDLRLKVRPERICNSKISKYCYHPGSNSYI